MSAVRELSPGIVSDPDRICGQPSIAGRRLFAATVANLVIQGTDREEIADDYSLTQQQIDNALAWHEAGRPE